MDYRKFLGATESLVLPSFGATFVEAPGRRLRLTAPAAPGWWRFEVKGRQATPAENAEADISVLQVLPAVRGHLVGDRVVTNGAVAEPIYFLPEDEPARFSPVRARRWPTGQVIFETIEFETDAEENARRALEDGRTLAAERGIPATLRAAFGFALAEQIARRLDVPISPAEIEGSVLDIAAREDGRQVAEKLISGIAAEREAYARAAIEAREARDRVFAAERERKNREELARTRLLRAREAAKEIEQHRRRMRGNVSDAKERAEAALHAAGAEMLEARRLEGELMEVAYRFRGERFRTIVERESLRVVDAGICLAGYDDRVTLESLPAVIRQAMEEHRLVITRRSAQDARGTTHWEREYVHDPDA